MDDPPTTLTVNVSGEPPTYYGGTAVKYNNSASKGASPAHFT